MEGEGFKRWDLIFLAQAVHARVVVEIFFIFEGARVEDVVDACVRVAQEAGDAEVGF